MSIGCAGKSARICFLMNLVLNSGIIVAKIVEYLLYRFNYRNTATKDITEDFSDRIEPEIALEL